MTLGYAIISCVQVTTQQAHVIKEKVDKLDIIKIKNFYDSKDTIKKVKHQPTEWKKIFGNHISDKGLISKIYKVYNSIIQRQITQFENGQRIWINFSPKGILMINKHRKDDQHH